MTDSAFARAAQQASGQSTQPATDPMTGNREGYDPMFGGQSYPSLFTKHHGPGTTLTGIVSDVPFDKHSREYKRDGTLGALQYWDDETGKPTDKPVDARGQARRKVEDWVYPLRTEYRDRATSDREDDGTRAFYAGNKYQKGAMRAAIRAAGVSSREQIKGMRLTITRSGEEGKWDYSATLTRD